MASLQKRGDSWRIFFQYRGQQHTFAVGDVPEVEAYAWKGKIEHLLLRVKQNLLDVPAGVDIDTFLRHDGKPPEVVKNPAREITLAGLRDDYVKTHRSSLEANTVGTIEMHFRHLSPREKYTTARLQRAKIEDALVLDIARYARR